MQNDFNAVSVRQGTQELVAEIYRDSSDLKKARAIISAGVNLNADVDGYEMALPPLSHAAAAGLLDIVKMLVDAGANVALQGQYGAFPLGVAVSANEAAVVEYLIDAGANVNQQDPNGQTAFMLALEQGHISPAQVLIHALADVTLQDANGKTARVYASYDMANAKLCAIRDLLRERELAQKAAAPIKCTLGRPRRVMLPDKRALENPGVPDFRSHFRAKHIG